MSTEMEAVKKMKISTETDAWKPANNELQDSLIESEILPKLPAKSVGRFKSVCKRWNSFLSTPTFGRMHFQYHGTTIKKLKLLVLDGFTIRKLPFTDTIPSNPNPDSIDAIVLASLDGLVLLASTTNGSDELVFWNPLTGAYRKLSPCIIDPDDCFYYSAVGDVVGFYKDDNDYKLLYLKRRGEHGAYIYSSRFDTWKQIQFSSAFKTNAFCRWSHATLLDQCLYFTVRESVMTLDQNRSWIICFDVTTETFRKIGFPESGGSFGSLVVLNGRLHLRVSDHLWRMMDGDEWVKVAEFTNPWQEQLRRITDVDVDEWLKAPAAVKNPWQEQRISTVTVGNWVAVLDQGNNSFKKVNTDDFISCYPYFRSTSDEYSRSRIIYVETLVSPNP